MFEGTKNLGDIQEKRRLFSKINRFYLFYRILAFITIIFTSLSLTYPMLIPNPLSPQTIEHIYNKKNREIYKKSEYFLQNLIDFIYFIEF